jgi:organic radical activating enzyme
MFFPRYRYDELPVGVRNTLQVFVTRRCNLACESCFARNTSGPLDMTWEAFMTHVNIGVSKGTQQITLIGGEPLLYPRIANACRYVQALGLRCTVYTNGYLLGTISLPNGVKIRASIYYAHGPHKSLDTLTNTMPVDICFMVGIGTKVSELLEVVDSVRCRTLFISSLRELDNPRHEFFDDTAFTMPILEYKELVHTFLHEYTGPKEIHVSKRGVFESTLAPAVCHCRFANVLTTGEVIQCPYDMVNMRTQDDYEFGDRPCQHNSTCLMSKVVYRRKG